MPSPRRRPANPAPSFVSPPPRQLPDDEDPARQPMPERNPDDPPVNPAPDAPPNGDDDSGPLTDTPSSSLPPAAAARTGSPLHRPPTPRRDALWHPSPPRDPDDGDDDPNGEPDEDDPDPDQDGDEVDEPNVPDPGEPAGLPEKSATATNHTHPLTTGNVRYESRIQILDAFQYNGSLKEAPDWVDRNWIAYASDEDTLRGIPAGPCLRVPSANGENVLCRIGDFVARQEIRLVADIPGDIRVEVWAQEQFFKLFLPVAEKPFRPFNPSITGVTATIEHEA